MWKKPLLWPLHRNNNLEGRNHNLKSQPTKLIKMSDSLGLGFWLVFLFGIGSKKFLHGDTLIAWETGLGYSAPICTTLSEVYRYEKNVLKAFIALLVAISRGLYIAIKPQHIFTLEYVLANLYVLYAIGVIVLSYQAWRNADYGKRTAKKKSRESDSPRPTYACGICSLSFPLEDLFTFDCPRSHTYHDSCLFERARQGQAIRNRCPECDADHPIRQQTYPRSEPNFLDKSRLMWYINSLFSRRIRLLVRRFGYQQRPALQNASPMRERALLQALCLVLVVHMFSMTSLVIFVYIVHTVHSLPFGWLVQLFILLYITATLS
ncbi:hypothetical protein F5B22DRAFT_568045 [Xylaria bambusicola]|uniref:uncharacterized protein n=1 Tax=Xylaria bambusicola TaxID=326684 RepID=UPI002008EAA3|nr:uncharacterized protein F5B22DRAFT_568045 [Xylaria bambusicola]KAI0521272.1 hypothetical protein F5B22DRAFT_568045 [Xylaria bambusicola]